MRLLSASLLVSFTALAPTAGAQDISLRLPVACEVGKTCFIQHYVDRDPSTAAQDYRCGTITYDGHDGTDIRLPTLAAQKAGVAVLAAADGKVLRIRDGIEDVSVAERGGKSVDNRECGNGAVVEHGQGWETQYCHMAKGSLRVGPGETVKAGDVLGRIGLSGMTEFPHLHFTLRKDGAVVDPFSAGPDGASCGGGQALWEASARQALSYRAGQVLNKGFAEGPVEMAVIESGAAEQALPNTRSPALVAYVRAIGLKGGDEQILTLLGPDAKPIAQNKAAPLDRDKAQWMMFAGTKPPADGFPAGLYRAIYTVTRAGEPVIQQAFAIDLRP